MAFFEIRNLLVRHKTFEGIKTVLDIDNITLEKGETYGVVGESGQGKTVLALTILKLLACPPGIIERGEILLDGENLLKKSFTQMRRRGEYAAEISAPALRRPAPAGDYRARTRLRRRVPHRR